MTREFLLTAGAILLLAGPPALAQGSADPETRDLIERLRPTPEQLHQTRGIRMPVTDPAAVAPAAPTTPVAAGSARPPRPAAGTTAPPGMAAASITVNFATGSHALSPQAVEDLTSLGRALASSDLAGFRFRIEGHTDTVGDAEANMALSQRRAEAVRDFLVTRFNIPSARLVAVGLGEGQLLVSTGDNTDEPRNRRVQVVNLGS